jgi:hypothetical protein
MSKKIYCGIGKVPKGYRLGSMVECLEKGKVNLYGLHKIYSKLIKQKQASKKKGSKKEKQVKEVCSIRTPIANQSSKTKQKQYDF